MSVEAYESHKLWNEFFYIEGINVPDGIDNVTSDATLGKTYGINGTSVGEGYKGIVIRGGKKILVK